MFSAEDSFHPYEFTRHAIGDNDIQIEILYAGSCHSDLHAAWDEQQEQGLHATYPMIPGHEIAGRMAKVGKNVTKFKVGDLAGVGYSDNIVVSENFAIVTVFDRTEEKRADAARMGATRYVNVNNPEEMKGLRNTFDFIISTIPANYEPIQYVTMLKMGGEMAIVGLPDKSTLNIANMAFLSQRKVYGSLIGGIKETQEMLDYSVAHDIYPEVEIIKADASEIDKAWRNVADGKVKFRYVIDMSTIK